MSLPAAFDWPYLALLVVLDGIALLALRRRATLLAASCLLAGVVAIPLLSGELFLRLRLLAWQVFVHLPVLLLVGAWLWRGRRWPRRLAVFAAVALWAVALDAFVVEPHALVVSRVALHDARVPRPLRIALVADLQTDAVGDYERRVLGRVMAARPDLILLAGDYVQAAAARGAAERRAFNTLLRELDFGAPLGAYAVEGNVEAHAPRWPALFAGTRVTPLPERRTLAPTPGLSLTALPLDDSFRRDLVVGPAPGYHVVLGHAPDFALGAVDAALLLAGHTHGGQVRLPLLGPVMTLSRVPRAWAAGVTVLAPDRTLVVSRGIGMERGYAPRLRFNCRPEIVIIDLAPTAGKTPSGGDQQDRGKGQHEAR